MLPFQTERRTYFLNDMLTSEKKPSFQNLKHWCGREDSNFHGVIPHKHLKLARLPFRHGRSVADDYALILA